MGIKRDCECSVYFMRPVGADGPVKIGCTMHPDKRLHQMMRWSPVVLELALVFQGTPVIEEQLHEYFADLRLHHEWFQADPRIDVAIEAIRAGSFVFDALPTPKRAA